MTKDIDSPESRRERSIERRDQDDSSIRVRCTGGYDDIEEDGVEKSKESSKHRSKEKSKSSRREDKDHRSKDREQSKTSHGSKDREKDTKDLEKDRLASKDRRNDDRDKQGKEKSHDKDRDRDVDCEKYKDRERDKDRKDWGKEKERERERNFDRDSERGRDKERVKERSRDKEKEREKERVKHKEQGKGRENDRDRLRDVADKEKGKERTREREREADQDGERQRDKDKGSHKHWDEGHDRSKYLRKDDKASTGNIDNQDPTKMDAGSHDTEDGTVTLKHQQSADGGDAGSHSSALELEQRIMKMREERLKKSEGGSEVLSWINKSRKIEEKRNAEREKALYLSKIFEEQDNMNGGSDDDDDNNDTMQNTSHDLAGVKVLHGLDKVLEGGAVVLTLKDQSIISAGGVNEEVDVLENVEIGEQKQRDDAYKAAKGRTGIYDDKFNDDSYSERKILPQYDDPAVDEGLTLDARGSFTGEAEKKLEELRRRIQGIPKSNNAEDLNAKGKVLSDYYTQEEMVQFKKPKKKKSLRKKEKLDIEALEAEAKSVGLGLGDLGSRSDGRKQALREEQERYDTEMRNSAYQSALAKADEASKALHLAQNSTTQKDKDDTPVIGDDDDDLRKSLDRARKLALKKHDEALTSNPLAMALLVSSSAENKNSASAETSENKVVLTEMELWSRQLDEGVEDPDAEDVFMEEDVPNISEPEAKEEDGGWSEVKESMEQETSEIKEEEMVPEDTIHEVAVGRGLAGALKLLKERGSLKETIEWGGRNMDKKKSKLIGIHEDEGPKEIHLERTDEYGRILTPKEAFRLLSHKFHGKGPGKMKQEKRMRQYQEELKVKQMKNADTPSLSVERMKEAQAKLRTPYLVLSGHVKPGQTSDPRSGFATVEKDLPGGLTPMLGDKKVEFFLGKRKAEPGDGDTTSEKKPKI